MAEPSQPTKAPADDEETEPFLCAVAAESVNDAIQLIDGMQCDADPLLRRAFEILVTYASTEPGIEPGSTSRQPRQKSSLSATAIDLIVQQTLCDADTAQRKASGSARGKRRRTPAHVGTFDPKRQRAIMLMMEALSLLDQLDDLEAVTHLQLAIDRTIEGSSSDLHVADAGNESQSRPN